MKAYILGENKIYPYLKNELCKMMDIYTNIHKYTDEYTKILKKSDLLLKTSFTDVIILLDNSLFNNKISLFDGDIVFDERIVENYKNCLWIGLYRNEKIDYLIDKYNLNFVDLSNSMPYFLTSKIALSEIVLNHISNTTSKLAHQNKILITSYNDYNKIIADKLAANKYIVIVTDKLLHKLIEAKSESFGIVLKEELIKSPIKFDYIICDDLDYLKFVKIHDNQKIIYIDYKESNLKINNIDVLNPSSLITLKYSKVIAESISTSIKKEIKEYFRGD